MSKASAILFCPSQFITINLICYKLLQHYNSTLNLSYNSFKIQCLTVDTTLEKGGKLVTLTDIILVAHSHKSLSNGSDSKLMTLFSYNQNIALTRKKSWDTGSKRVKHTILPEPLHTIQRECERSCRQAPHIPRDTTEQH